FAFVGLAVGDPETAQAAAFPILAPLVFASSAFVSTATMPGWLRAFAEHQPVSVTASAVRALLEGGPTTKYVLQSLAWIVAVIAWNDFAADDLVFNSLGIFSSLLYATIGLLITLRARNVIGWILMFAGLALAFVGFGTTYVAVGLLTSPGSLPAPKEVTALTQVLWVPTLVSLAVMVLLFPTGSLPSPRWRPVLWMAIAGAAVGFLLLVVNPGRLEPDKGITFQNPLGIQSLRGLISTTLVGVAWVTSLAVAGCIIGLVVRYRRRDAELRQQVKWLALGAAGAGAGLLVTLGSLVACHCRNSGG